MKLVPLTRGFTARIDDEDESLISSHRWTVSIRKTRKYAKTYVGNKQYLYMHRLISCPPPDLETDHIDGDGLNNQRSNLRQCTRSQNNANAIKKRQGTSLFKGVWRSSKGRKWVTQISDGHNRRVHIGTFDTEEAAALAYNAAATSRYGCFARLNDLKVCVRVRKLTAEMP